MKKMSEREAWLHLAKAWTEPFTDDGDVCVIDQTGLGFNFGLCHCIEDLEMYDFISIAVETRMLNKIPARSEDDDYCWPLTVEGAGQRAAFCRKMASQLAAKSKKRKTAKGA